MGIRSFGAALAAGAAACALSAPAQAQNSFGADAASAGFTAAQVKAAIQGSGDVAIVKEASFQNQPVYIVSHQGLNLLMMLTCPTGPQGKCPAVTFATPYPAQIRSDASRLNGLNSESGWSWLSVDGNGGVYLQHGLIFAGLSLDGFLENTRVYAAVYALRGQELMSSAASTVSYDKAGSREHIIDASHKPAEVIGLSPELLSLFQTSEIRDSLVNTVGDAQTAGELRKIANDYLGD